MTTFSKLHGIGNSFIIIEENELSSSLSPSDFALRVCDSGFGIGADGVMIIEGMHRDLWKVSMWNPDGTSMGMCGNGIRCVYRFLVHRGHLDDSHTQDVQFLVDGKRNVTCSSVDGGLTVKVNMGAPEFSPTEIPVDVIQDEVLDYPVVLGAETLNIWCVSMGNPHCVLFDWGMAEPLEIGKQLEVHSLFPKRTNVECVEIHSLNSITVHVWERGAGATKACGTGACASVVAAVRAGLCEGEVDVKLPGGRLIVEWDREINSVFLTGPTVLVCDGKLEDL